LLLSLLVGCQVREETSPLDGGSTAEKFEDQALLVNPDGDFLRVVAFVVVEFVSYTDSV
jgi:hypothetical protein